MRILVIILLIITLIVLGLFAYKNTTNKMPDIPFVGKNKLGEKQDNQSKKKEDDKEIVSTSSVEIVQQWEMPEVLTEISDISNIDDNSIACVQDETGTIYIYDLKDGKIKKEIPFAGKGDFEGIALAGSVAYAVNSSGVIYEVDNIKSNKPTVKEYKTFLTAKDDVEALCYDKENNRLLLAFKKEEGAGSSKGIYSFSLTSRQLAKDPIYTINFESVTSGKNKKKGIRPSAIAIHPATGDIYITEGTNPQLLIADKQGKVKSLIQLNKKDFAQPEGITFNSAGEMFISNEGKKGSGNILKVKL